MRYVVCDTDSYVTWPYQIADHNYCRITWVYKKDITSCNLPLTGDCLNNKNVPASMI